jgi:hypothetical protein
MGHRKNEEWAMRVFERLRGWCPARRKRASSADAPTERTESSSEPGAEAASVAQETSFWSGAALRKNLRPEIFGVVPGI